MRRSSFFVAALFAPLFSCAAPGGADPGESGEGSIVDASTGYDGKLSMNRETLVVVVRHAEKADDDPVDPSLSEAGQLRAQELAKVLNDAKVSAIYTSQFKRTKQTAEPLALATGLAIQERPITGANLPTYASNLAQEIRQNHAGQTVVVVSHSNTVPPIVTALSGAAAAPIPETEFSRLYTVTVNYKGEARVVAARY